MPNFRQDIRSEQGVGLIDMLVAIVLLGVAVVALMAGFTYASAGTRENRGRIQAIMLAQETMEYLKQNDGVNALDLAAMVPSDGKRVGNANANYLQYRITPVSGVVVYTVTENAALLNSKLRSVTVTVSWIEAGVNRSLSMVEYIYLR